jgi:hypothetical protein
MAVPDRGHDMLCFVPERSDTGRPLQSSSGLVICQRVATDLVRAAVEKALGVRHCGWRPVIGRGAVAADRPSRHKRADKSFRAPKFHYNTFSPRYGSALRSGESHHGLHGEAVMSVVLNDLLLFSCLTALVTGIVIAAATLLI